MYEELFQTTNRPFRATPDVRYYFPFESMEQARQTVLRAVRRAEGPVAVMGGVGLGKSLLASLLAEDLADRFDVVRLHATRLCSRRAMLQNILFELQLPYRELSEGELRLSLMERMEPSPVHAAEGLALIVDEAQTLPTKLLEELRLITNFARQGHSRARLVLLGGMQLEETLALPELSSFNQRLAARCFLQPMNRIQTADFVRHQFTCSQVDPKQVITRDALENVYIASEGIPRLVNQVMDHALILAIASDQYPISASLIQEAWADLQQLPVSWNQADVPQGAPVEFGSIDDLDQDFELEPEGLEELEVSGTDRIDWPVQSDLEEIGPTYRSLPAAAPEQPAPRPAAPRVVFDASQVFARPSGPVAPLSALPASKTDWGDHDMFVFRDDLPAQPDKGQSSAVDSSDDQPTVVRNMFAAWNPSPETYTYEIELSIDGSGDDDGQREEYKLAQDETVDYEASSYEASSYGASNYEASDYEASDYQLAAWPEEMQVNSPQPLPVPVTAQSAAQDPFGQDFDEEFSVEATDVRRWQTRPLQRPKPSKAAVPPVVLQSEEGRLTNRADMPAVDAARSPMDGEDVPIESQTVVVQPDYADQQSFVTTANATVDGQMLAEIEDLVSQLNFSAFSVEMDSVEQISPQCIREAAAAHQLHQDSEHESEQALVIPMRSVDQPAGVALDDDRDLLVIEEDVPSSMRHAPVAGPPAAIGVSYPDLFQQLRG